ncbi:3-deoxy-D-manno-octulosonic acid transferase [Maritimibacter alkaliphilus]|uniref:3-deoxy-D-manno-octulosonic acid transferase n=1 Tax=Maritimibacter alkaliphilus TaxID=404236 RepID=UPI001C9516D1|nr:3-deoxy-D-manno-octulosonic acid transferase [Maritimibacter alkaliphilus]MBY6090168.1 3-deoxy-D-manno-octulosonic acid transferase [Maritimibacter alkaliphilus]
MRPAALPPLYHLYSNAARLLAPVLRRRLTEKHLREGGDPARVGERFGRATLPRPEGPLLWVHAVSVGETVSALPLIEAALAEDPTLHALLTTTTITSAQIAADRLPTRARHQFAPIDVPQVFARFLAHWRPDIAVLTESEIWPGQIATLHRRGIPLAMVNARLSASSARGWQRFAPRLARALFSRVALILAQDAGTRTRMEALGADPARNEVTGSLKTAASPLKVDPQALTALTTAIGPRPLWVAASTHPGEEEILLDTHRTLLADHPQALLLLAPRHPDRAQEVAALITARDLSYSTRSADGVPGPRDQVFLADTLGEMGLWFSAAPVAFMGGSLLDNIGGHNPVEPAQAGCAILSGPHVANAEELYAALTAAGGAQLVAPEPPALAAALAPLLDGTTEMGARARDWVRTAAARPQEIARRIRALAPQKDPQP